MDPAVTIVRSTNRVQTPWRNGRGVTEEIAKSDGGRPRWRVSIAELTETPTTFSAFDGMTRIFTVIGDNGVTFETRGWSTSIEPLTPFEFDGAATPVCTPSGPSSAFNVMTEAGAGHAAVTTADLRSSAISTDPDAVTVAFVHSGSARADQRRAGPGDCIVIRRAAHAIDGTGILVVATIKSSTPDGNL